MTMIESGEVCDGCGKLLICLSCGKFRSPAVAQSSQVPVAWRYTCADGSVELMLKRLTDEQKRRGYYTGEDGEDEVDGDEAVVGPFYWAEETPLYAAQPPAAPEGEAAEIQRTAPNKALPGAFPHHPLIRRL